MSRLALPLHPLAKSHYFNKWFIRFDKMHVMDHRGVICIAAGSLIYKIVATVGALGPRQEDRLQKINEAMKEFQSVDNNNTPHRMPPLRLSNLRNSGWSELHGPVVKSANTRCLLPFCMDLANTYFGGDSSYEKSVRKVFQALLTIESILYSSEMFLTDKAKADLKEAFLKLGRHWQNLRHLSSELRENCWQVTPKVHICQHFPEQSELVNPVFVQNYQEESFIGFVTKLWAKCARGPYERNIQLTTLNRYWVGLELRITA